jgi:DNA (cytosine-5)-methyltransferase 1
LEQISIFDYLETANNKPFKIDKPVKLIELFGGIGSQAMSLRDLGIPFESNLVEIDSYAVKSYNAIHGTDFETKDIRNVKGADLEIKDTNDYCYVLCYSFPCQDLSVAGKQLGMKKDSGTRSSLLWEVTRILDECEQLSYSQEDYGMPQVLLMENVPQVHSKKNMPDFIKTIISAFAGLSVITFILTENITTPMRLIDPWT